MNAEYPDHKSSESMLIEALERKPEIVVPGDFHQRLRVSLASEPVRSARTRISFARATAYAGAICLSVFLAVLTLLHPDAVKSPESMTFILELMLLAQLMAVGFWLGVRREN